MRKTTFFRTLLVATGLLVGSSAWADAGDKTTVANITFDNNSGSEQIITGEDAQTVPGMTFTVTGTNFVIQTNGVLRVGLGTGTFEIPEAQRAGYAHKAENQNNDVVTISFSMAFGNTSGSQWSGFEILDEKDEVIVTLMSSKWAEINTEANTFNLAIGTDLTSQSGNDTNWGQKTDFTIEFDYLNNKATCKTNNNPTGKSINFPEGLPVVAKFVLKGGESDSNTSRTTRYALFDDLKIENTEGDYTAEFKAITIKYVDESGADISEDLPAGTVTSTAAVVGSEFTPTYPESFQTDDYVYTYKEGARTIDNVTEDEEITLVYTKTARSKVTVQVKCVDANNNQLALYDVAENVAEGSDVTYAISKYIVKDGKLYQTNTLGTNYYVGITQASATPITITYNDKTTEGTTPAYFEDFGEGIAAPGTTEYLRCSGGQTATNAGDFILVPANTLENGIYTFEIGHYKNRTPLFYVGENEIGSCNTGANAGTYVTTTFTDVIVLDKVAIIVKPGSGQSYVDNMDYVLAVKTADIPNVSATVTDAGWATLYTSYPLDFSAVEGLTAYTATVADGVVTLTEVSDVPANTGVVLKGDVTTYDIPVIASSETDGGQLQGSTTATVYNAEEGYTYYVLAQNDDKVQFCPVVSGSIAAGKAFLKLETPATEEGEETESNLRVVIAGEATGIAGVEAVAADGVLYNVAGQPVTEAYKGFVIKNGKKYLNK